MRAAIGAWQRPVRAGVNGRAAAFTGLEVGGPMVIQRAHALGTDAQGGYPVCGPASDHQHATQSWGMHIRSPWCDIAFMGRLLPLLSLMAFFVNPNLE